MIKQHVIGLEGSLDLIPILWEGAPVLGIQVGLDIWSHVLVGLSQPDHVLRSTLVLGTVVHHAVYPVEEVGGWEVFPVEGLGSLMLGLGSVIILLWDFTGEQVFWVGGGAAELGL